MKLYDNILGILTNDPPLLYHWENLILYNELSPYVIPNATINEFIIPSISGAGMKGLPGSWSSIDRFVRISSLIRFIQNLNNAIDGVLSATYILNSVYTSPGMISDYFNGNKIYVNTRWASIKDLTNKIFYFRNHDGAIKAIYLKNIDFDQNVTHTPLSIYQNTPFILDVTTKLH
jgi:choloylglycine hydrolase